MANKIKTEIAPCEGQPGPDHTPKEGEKVNYIFHENAGNNRQGKVYPATVKAVHEGTEGRLINVEVELPDGPQRIGPTPFREYEEAAPAGNTWHYPEEAE
jgi:hypothetical protein